MAELKVSVISNGHFGKTFCLNIRSRTTEATMSTPCSTLCRKKRLYVWIHARAKASNGSIGVMQRASASLHRAGVQLIYSEKDQTGRGSELLAALTINLMLICTARTVHPPANVLKRPQKKRAEEMPSSNSHFGWGLGWGWGEQLGFQEKLCK